MTEVPAQETVRILFERIVADDDDAMTEFYLHLKKLFEPRFREHLGREFSMDRLHDLAILLIENIRAGNIQKPESLLAYAWTACSFIIRAQIRENQLERQERRIANAEPAGYEPNPEEQLNEKQRHVIDIGRYKKMQELLSELSPIDAEILMRFYFDEQSQETIQKEMNISNNQYRGRKYRGKAKWLKKASKVIRFPKAA